MLILDENIPASQVSRLRDWRMRVRVVGIEVARFGIKDPNLIPVLHRSSGATFFTRDEDFFDRRLCHARYCLVWLNVAEGRAADFIRRFLKHPGFNTQARRNGIVARVLAGGVQFWQLGKSSPQAVEWPDS